MPHRITDRRRDLEQPVSEARFSGSAGTQKENHVLTAAICFGPIHEM